MDFPKIVLTKMSKIPHIPHILCTYGGLLYSGRLRGSSQLGLDIFWFGSGCTFQATTLHSCVFDVVLVVKLRSASRSYTWTPKAGKIKTKPLKLAREAIVLHTFGFKYGTQSAQCHIELGSPEQAAKLLLDDHSSLFNMRLRIFFIRSATFSKSGVRME